MGQGTEKFPGLAGETRNLVAEKTGIGSGKQYEKERMLDPSQNSDRGRTGVENFPQLKESKCCR